jgi:hypothetical protein
VVVGLQMLRNFASKFLLANGKFQLGVSVKYFSYVTRCYESLLSGHVKLITGQLTHLLSVCGPTSLRQI